MDCPYPLSDSARDLVDLHRTMIGSVATERDTFSLAQPSPLRYVPSFTTDHTAIRGNLEGPSDRRIDRLAELE